MSNHQTRSFPDRILSYVGWSCCVFVASLAVCWFVYPRSLVSTANSFESDFFIASDQAMEKMMSGMKIKESGDVDRDFTSLMIPHHQGGIDMARAELQYGKNEQLRRIAQEIIVAQQQEIVAMRLAIGDPPPPSAPAPAQSKRANERSSSAVQPPVLYLGSIK